MEIDVHNLWAEIAAHEGEMFYTASNLPFTYTVRGGEFFTGRKKKSITRATFERALMKIQADEKKQIVGPKTLNVFGAPYIWAVFVRLGIVSIKEGKRRHSCAGTEQISFLPEEDA